jgi:hypothetical protein
VRRACAGEIRRSSSARTDPGAVVLYVPRWRRSMMIPAAAPTRTRLSSTRRRGSRSPTIFPNTQRVSPARTLPQFLTGRSHAIAVRAATLSVCWSFGEGTSAGKQGNGRDAPIPVVRGDTNEPPESTRLSGSSRHHRFASKAPKTKQAGAQSHYPPSPGRYCGNTVERRSSGAFLDHPPCPKSSSSRLHLH